MFVLSSLFEGMPNALMEAMAIGLPCVSTDCPNGPAELFENGVNGHLVPGAMQMRIAYAILRYIEDKDFAKCAVKTLQRSKKLTRGKKRRRFLNIL
jgi:glycosyltransferase involved in cell wall biosynthesis